MNRVLAIVNNISGNVYARNQDGVIRILKAGDKVYEGETLITGDGGSVDLQMLDGAVVTIGQNRQLPMTGEAFAQIRESEGDQETEVDEPTRALTEEWEYIDPYDTGEEYPYVSHGYLRVEKSDKSPDAPDYRFVSINSDYDVSEEGRSAEADPLMESRATHDPRLELLLEPIDILGQDGFEPIIVQFDGPDRFVSIDTRPKIGNPDNALVDEDDLVPDGTDQSDIPSDGGSLGIIPGSGSIDTVFEGNTPPAGLTSEGKDVKYYVSDDGHVLIGYTGDLPSSGIPSEDQKVFEIVINDPDSLTGQQSYVYTQIDQLEHPAGDGENELVLTFNYSVKDTGGGSESSSFSVTVVDDVPIPTEGVVSGYVDEDELRPYGITDNDEEDTTWSSASPTAKGSGTLLDLFEFGADQPGTVGMRSSGDIDGQAVKTTGDADVYSQGEQVFYDYVSDTVIYGRTGDGDDVFRLEITSPTTGNYTFELLRQLDHPNGDGDDEETMALDLTGVLQGKDYDQDPIEASGTFVMTVEDDVPAATDGSVTGWVDEDELSGGNQDGDDETTVWNSATETSLKGGGSLADLFNIGADQPGTISIKSSAAIDGQAVKTTGDADVYSQGEQVFYDYVSDTVIYGRTGDGDDVFRLEITSPTTGNYTFELLRQLDHPNGDGDDEETMALDLTSVIAVQAKDYDLDPIEATGSFIMRVEDDVPAPTEGVVSGYVDEDELEPHGITDNDDETTTWDSTSPTSGLGSGSLGDLFDIGADQPGTILANTSDAIEGEQVYTTGSVAVESKDEAVVYHRVSDTIVEGRTVTTDELVFTLTITDQETGDYTFELHRQLDHPTGDGDDDETMDLDLTAAVQAKDYDLDPITATGAFVMTVEDDVPELDDDPQLEPVSGKVYEDALGHEGDPADQYTGNYEDLSTQVAQITGDGVGGNPPSIPAIFNSGADHPGGFGITQDVALLNEAATGLTSKGEQLVYSVNPEGSLLTATAGNREVFTLQVNTDGIWSFNLNDQLDHVDEADDESTDLKNSTGGVLASLDFTGLIIFSDSDNDIVSLGSYGENLFTIEVENDIPEAPSPINGAVHEDALGNDGDSDDQSTGIEESPAVQVERIGGGAAGDTLAGLSSLVQSGAGDPITFGVTDDTSLLSALPALLSKGDDVSYSVNPAGTVLTATAGGRTVFTLTVNADGSWSFDLEDQLDHVDGAGDASTDLKNSAGGSFDYLDFTGVVTIKDADNDTELLGVYGDGLFTVTVENDVPGVEPDPDPSSINGTVHEDALGNDGDSDDQSTGIEEDDPNQVERISEGGAGDPLTNLNSIVAGADEPYSFGLTGTQSLLDAASSGLQSKGDDVSYSVNPAGTVLTATAGGRTVFTLTVNADGSWSFDLEDQLDHVDGAGDASTDLKNSAGGSFDYLDFTGVVTIKDADNDTELLGVYGDGLFTVTVENDVPGANPDEDEVSEDTVLVASGNVIDGTETDTSGYNPAEVDKSGADEPISVTYVSGVTAGAIGQGGNVTVDGQYGSLNLGSDGDYTYTLDNANPDVNALDDGVTLTEVFTYTVTDADGDTSQTTLTITINGNSDSPPVLVVGKNVDDVDGETETHFVPNPYLEDSGEIIGGPVGDILIGDIGGSSIQGKDLNLVVVIDTSNSMNSSIPGSTSRLQALKNSLNGMLEQLSESDADNVRVHIVEFNGTPYDSSPDSQIIGTYDIRTGGNANTTELNEAESDVNALDAQNGTNYEAGLQQAIEWWSNSANQLNGAYVVNQTIFLSDGEPTFWYAADETNDNGFTTIGPGNFYHPDALAHITGTHTDYHTHNSPDLGDSAYEWSDPSSDWQDTVSEVDIINSFGVVESVGIDLPSGSSGLDVLDVIEGAAYGSGVSDNVETAQELYDTLQDISPVNLLSDVGGDQFRGGNGNDVILGDAPFADDLATDAGLSLNPGSGYLVFQALEQGESSVSGYDDWDRQDTIDYITNNAEELSQESVTDDGGTRGGGNDTIDGGGGDDIIYAQEGDDTIIYDENDSVVDGGSGYDVISIDSGDDIDFSVLGTDTSDPMPFSDIEELNIENGTGDNSISSLSAQDVLDMTDGDDELAILGDNGDSVSFAEGIGGVGGWTYLGISGGFHDYTLNGAIVKIDQDITDVT